MTDKIKQLETEIVYLKARAFELTEGKAQLESHIQQLSGVLSKVTELVGIVSEDGSVKVEELYAAIEAMLPKQGEAEV
ncbi:tail fiber chaperone [Citrobacter phage Merlin]|uniref:Chaperone for long tail fiber formation n=1 Tax=Citrobacter phage Merlin TaxID=1675602 RepID=A0A0K1LMW9_9CAUD|nr:tail fiber chaperone [Citrobacter phage Merlin]AKU43814.1 chaperone for long tail fiber formation [Citrobacter phage Merlin]